MPARGRATAGAGARAPPPSPRGARGPRSRVPAVGPDPGRYDLLASEARLASFVAIAKGDVPVSHWFRLGRALTPVEQDSVLVSWAGSMFEYLMPALVMRAPAGSLLDQTSRLPAAPPRTSWAARRARSHAEPMVRATELLLQERTPRDVAVARPRVEEVQAIGDVREFIPPVVRHFTSPHGSMPGTHLLSNGRYAVMLTTAGPGDSPWRGS